MVELQLEVFKNLVKNWVDIKFNLVSDSAIYNIWPRFSKKMKYLLILPCAYRTNKSILRLTVDISDNRKNKAILIMNIYLPDIHLIFIYFSLIKIS